MYNPLNWDGMTCFPRSNYKGLQPTREGTQTSRDDMFSPSNYKGLQPTREGKQTSKVDMFPPQSYKRLQPTRESTQEYMFYRSINKGLQPTREGTKTFQGMEVSSEGLWVIVKILDWRAKMFCFLKGLWSGKFLFS